MESVTSFEKAGNSGETVQLIVGVVAITVLTAVLIYYTKRVLERMVREAQEQQQLQLEAVSEDQPDEELGEAETQMNTSWTGAYFEEDGAPSRELEERSAITREVRRVGRRGIDEPTSPLAQGDGLNPR